MSEPGNVPTTDCSKAFADQPLPFLEAIRKHEARRQKEADISINLDRDRNIERAYKLKFAQKTREYGVGRREERIPLAELERADALPITIEMRGGELITRQERLDIVAEAGQ